MKNKSSKITILCFGISAVIFVMITLAGLLLPAHEEITYWLVSFFMIMPIVSLIVSVILGRKRAVLFWLFPIFAGLCGLSIPFIVFGVLEWISLFYGFIPAVLGLGVGLLWGLIFKHKT